MKNATVERLTTLAAEVNSHQFAVPVLEAIELSKVPGCPQFLIDCVAKCNRPTPPQHVLIRRHELKAIAVALAFTGNDQQSPVLVSPESGDSGSGEELRED